MAYLYKKIKDEKHRLVVVRDPVPDYFSEL